MWTARYAVAAASSTLRHHRCVVYGARGYSYLHAARGSPLQYECAGAALERVARAHPARLALHSLHEDRRYTYQQLLIEADALGAAWRERGLQRGARVALAAHNCAGWLVALVAALRVGLLPVLMNPASPRRELSACLRAVGARALVAGGVPARELAPLLPVLDARAAYTTDREPLPGTVSIEEVIAEGVRGGEAAARAGQYGAELSPDDDAIIHFTSGTTGVPKAPVGTHFAIVNQARAAFARFADPDDEPLVVCVQVPLFHALGSVVTALGALLGGHALVLPAPAYSARHNLHALLHHRCSMVVGTPTMFVDLAAGLRAAGGAGAGGTEGVRVALTAGAPCAPRLFADLQHLLPNAHVMSLYGMTETHGAVFLSARGERGPRLTDTVGRLHDHIEAKVVDEEGRVVGWGEAGELHVRGFCNMRRYWQDAAATRDALPGDDGWLRTGDIFTLSPDGYGRVVGRQKDLIVRGGENIAPKEVEDALHAHPDIIEAQVVGVRHERLGEQVCAVVRTRSGLAPGVPELRAHCAALGLAAHKAPRDVRVVASFPTTPSGKVQKHRLRDMIHEGTL